RADIVGLTGMTVQRFRMTEILVELKRRGCFVVLGGPWVSVKEDYFGELVDVVFSGEAETTWPQFLNDWRNGAHAKRYEQSERTDMSKVPVPRHELLKFRHYALGTIQFSRGCPFMCEFCDIIVTFGRIPRIKTAPQIIAELDALHRVARKNMAFIVDDNLIGNKKVVKEILRAVIAWQQDNNYPLTFITEASLDLADDEELLELMDRANVRSVFVGVETPNEEALKETKKIQNLRKSNRTIPEKIHAIQAHGIEVFGGMMLGFDSDDETIFDRQLKLVEEARIVHSSVGMVTAIPKTPLYERLERENRLDHADRTEYGTNVIPVKIGRQALRDGYLRVLGELYSSPNFFKRLDALYLEGGLGHSRLRHGEHNDGRVRAAARKLGAFAAGAFVFTQLQLRVRKPELRRAYRGAAARVLRRRPDPFVFQAYALKMAAHYHYDTLISRMMSSDGHLINMF
ncbi:MAG TPA: radical SAM protein, partial [Methylocystis sp.]|nr:radical SAM protein [Methylocystis sp.]